MQFYANELTEEQFSRIVVVGMGRLGGMVVRQVQRTLKTTECLLLEARDDIVQDFPALGTKVRGAGCVFIVVDPLDEEALNTANWLARRMMAERALVVIFTSDPSEHPDDGSHSSHPHFGRLACSSVVVSPLSINPLSEDVLPRYGKEMLATYLIRHVIEIVVRWMSEHSIPCIDFADIKAVMDGGGIMRLGVGMNANGEAGDATHKAIESLAWQGADISCCRGVLVCLSGSTNLTMDDFDLVGRTFKSMDEDALEVLGILVDDALGRTVKVTLLCADQDK